jgi:hypothetical protein
MSVFYEIIKVGPLSIESCPEAGVKPYPVREVRIKEHGRWKFNEFIGTISCKDALVDIHEGDLVAAELSFYVCCEEHPDQRVLIKNLIKLKETD